MPKRRRKLNPDFLKKITLSRKDIELIIAKINDIYDDDIQAEYKEAFNKVARQLLYTSELYDSMGFVEESIASYDTYLLLYEAFNDEYEI